MKRQFYSRILFLLICSYTSLFAQQPNNTTVTADASLTPLLVNLPQTAQNTERNFFIENKGQWDAEVRYLVRVGGMNAWITRSGIVYDMFRIERTEQTQAHPQSNAVDDTTAMRMYGHVTAMDIEGSGSGTIFSGEEKLDTYYNYILGNGAGSGHSFVPLYKAVTLENVYEKIGMRYYFDTEGLRYDFTAEPGADLSNIKLRFRGTDGVSINENGELVIQTSLGEVVHRKLFAYQEINGNKEQTACRFIELGDGTISFSADWKDKSKPLVIDPLIYSTYFGGTIEDRLNKIVVDRDGNIIIGGVTVSADFPVTTGAYDTRTNGGYDIFITKIDGTFHRLLFSTFIGGSREDRVSDLAAGSTGDIYLSGYTKSANYPTTPGAFDREFGSSTDYWEGVVTKVSNDGSALVFSTFIGGTFADLIYAIALGADESVYLTGRGSEGYPLSPGCYSTNWESQIVLTHLNNTGTDIYFSTFFGAPNGRYSSAGDIEVDWQGCVYIAGFTESSPDFPITPNAFQQRGTIFLTKFTPDGSALDFSTCFGAVYGYDLFRAMALMPDGSVYLTGIASSINFPITRGAYSEYLGGSTDIFISRMNAEGSGVIASTYLSAPGDGSEVRSIAVSPAGLVYVAGYTNDTQFPVTSDAFQNALQDASPDLHDGFVSVLNSNLTELIYSTYFGGANDDRISTLSLAQDDGIYFGGMTASSNLPVTSNAFFGTLQGGIDAFFSKLTFSLPFEELTPLLPEDGSFSAELPVRFAWKKNADARTYLLLISEDSLFHSTAYFKEDITDTVHFVEGLHQDMDYYWRIASINGLGRWQYSSEMQFRSGVAAPIIRAAVLYEDSVHVSWTQYHQTEIDSFRIYRGGTAAVRNLIATVSGAENNFYEQRNLDSTYYYQITAVTGSGAESQFSSAVLAETPNLPPVAVSIESISVPNAGKVLLSDYTFSAAGSYDPDGTIDSVLWFIADTLFSTESQMTHSFRQGATEMQLVIVDNRGGRDTSSAVVSITAFRKNLGGAITSSLCTAPNGNVYVPSDADTLYKIDDTGNILLRFPLLGKITKSPAVTLNGNIYYIVDDSLFCGYTQAGVPLWNPISLGGIAVTSPAVCSTTSGAYITLRNGTVLFISTVRGEIRARFFTNDSITASPIMSSKYQPTADDRILLVATAGGTVYGFDVEHLTADSIYASWTHNLGDSIASGPIIDFFHDFGYWNNYFYAATRSGILANFALDNNMLRWSRWTHKRLLTPPLVGHRPTVHVITEDGTYISADRSTGLFTTRYVSGQSSSIYPTMSYGKTIYFASDSGTIFCADYSGKILWTFAEESKMNNSLLHENGMLYYGTADGEVIGIYDGYGREGTEKFKPMWGTFMGNNFRNGYQGDIPAEVDEPELPVPETFALFQNYPNPFNPVTTVRFGLPEMSDVKIEVYSTLGELIASPVNTTLQAGIHEVQWNAGSFPSGVYFIRLNAVSESRTSQWNEVIKALLLK